MFRLEQRGPHAQQPFMQSVHNCKLTQTGSIICIPTFSKWQNDISVCFTGHAAVDQISGLDIRDKCFFVLFFSVSDTWLCSIIQLITLMKMPL